MMLVSLVLALILVAVIPFVAARGFSYRAVYLAVALAGLVVGSGCVMSTPSDEAFMRALNSGDAALAAGSEFLHAYGFDFAIAWFAIAFGSVLGAVTYRRRPAVQ